MGTRLRYVPDDPEIVGGETDIADAELITPDVDEEGSGFERETETS